MDARVLLYAVPGLPLRVDDLMPQPLLARCAGALRAHGHMVTIFDDGTVDALENMAGTELPEVLNSMLDGAAPSKRRWSRMLSAPRRHQNRTLASCLESRIERAVGASTVNGSKPHVAVILAQRRKDMREAQRLAQALRVWSPELCIVIAGKMAARYGRQIMATCAPIDAACVALPESSVSSLAAHWNDRAAWRQIPGLLTRTSTSLHEAPSTTSMAIPASTVPAYHPDIYPSLLDGGKFKIFTLGQSWGLSHTGHYRSELRSGRQMKAVRQLRQEIMGLHELYGAQVFHISGAHTPGDAVLEFARSCMSLPFPASYSRDAHIFELGTTTASVLATSGCQALGFSLLTGSQRTLTDFFGENWCISDAVSCLRACRESGIHLHTDFIHPIPVDDHHTRAETIRLLHRCKPDSIRLMIPELVPGSAWHQHASEFDFSLNQKQLESWVGAPVIGMNTIQEANLLPYALSGGQGSSPSQLLEIFEFELDGFAPPVESGCQAALIARVSGHQNRESAFIQQLEQAAKTLDIATLRTIIDTFNVQATASINTIDFNPSAAARKVVGN